MNRPSDIDAVSALLEDESVASAWCRDVGIVDSQRAQRNLLNLAESGVPLDLLGVLLNQLRADLPRLSDPDRALNNLDHFFQATRSPLSLVALFERDRSALTELLQIFASSQHQSDLLIADPSTFDRLRLSGGVAAPRAELVDELLNEVRCFSNEQTAYRLLHSFKHREMARIAYGDLIRGQKLEVVTRQLSYVADAVCEAAIWIAKEQLAARFGTPRLADGRECGFVIFGLGKLGGLELNYSSDIDLVFLYGADGMTDGGRSIDNHEYFQRLSRSLLQLLTGNSEFGVLYRVDLRLRPNGQEGALAISASAARQYYEAKGRTWERQAWLKARPVAGSLELGQRFLDWLTPWVYRKFLSYGDIQDIRAIKRQIERKAIRGGSDERDVKIGRGGIRDIEFVIQFLQLLYGGELASIRTGNTLDAIGELARANCLTPQEQTILEDNYVFLRKVEHFLQIMFDVQTHLIPDSELERRKLAIRMGFSNREGNALVDFERALEERRRRNRRILDHILIEAFSDEEPVLPEIDLILMPETSDETVHAILSKYRFHDTSRAYHELTSLAREQVPFLSDARCRRGLAAIVQPLLSEIATTPDPEATLVQLSHVSHSIGGKAALWELFTCNDASLKLYVRLCAAAPYLATILTSQPGMIDELMDSLVLGRLPNRSEIEDELAELCRGAEDIDPILHGFKNSLHLRVGVRDILGKDDVQVTTRTLSDVAEACLQQSLHAEFHRMSIKFGTPQREGGHGSPVEEWAHQAGDDMLGAPLDRCSALELDEDESDLVVLGMGKLGGREPNYHSDLDVVFLYDFDGTTAHRGRSSRGATTSNHHFFSELAQRTIRSITKIGQQGRLYEMDPRLRPAGRSGTMAVSFHEFRRYFADGRGQLWERQALCKARPVFGKPESRRAAMSAVLEILRGPAWEPDFAPRIWDMRRQLEETATPRNLKRGPGGTVDIEFLVQMLQLRYASENPSVLATGTLDALARLGQAGYLDEGDAQTLDAAYRFIRSVEARIRLMNSAARHEIPQEPGELEKLAYLFRFPSGSDLAAECFNTMRANRACLLRYVARLSA